MKTSVMVFHPHLAQSRINSAMFARAQQVANDELIVRNMYEAYPDFHIDVAREHEIADQADRLVFQFPFYWYSAPALMKEWEDTVLTPGWAYGSDAQIAGKTMLLAISAGGSQTSYALDGKHGATMDDFLLPYRITAQYLGLVFDDPFIVHGAYSADLDDRQLDLLADQYVARLLQ